MTSTHQIALRTAAVLWVIWGLVHMFAGVMTMAQDTSAAVAGIADAVDASLLVAEYHPGVGAIINQHGFNLLWIGTFTLVGAVFIWKASAMAILMTAIVGWVTDVGYFIFIDLGGFANFFPGTVMTIVSTAAVILSLWVYFTALKPGASGT